MRILEGLALDESLSLNQRLRVIEELGRIDRKAGEQRPDAAPEQADDPFGGYDELAQRRRERRAAHRRAG